MRQLGKGRLLARRNPPPTVTAELTPLIDVVFLLLTFFILAAVLMVRVDVLGIRLPTLAAGTPLQGPPPASLTVDATGSIAIDSQPLTTAELPDALARLAENNRPVVVAVDTTSPAGVLITVAEALRNSGVERFSVVGRPTPTATPRNEPPPAPDP